MTHKNFSQIVVCFFCMSLMFCSSKTFNLLIHKKLPNLHMKSFILQRFVWNWTFKKLVGFVGKNRYCRNKKKGTWETLRIWKKEKYEKKKIFPFFIYYICPVIHFFKNDFFHKIWIFWNREWSKVGFQFFSENSKKIQKKPCEKTKKMSKNPPPKIWLFSKKKNLKIPKLLHFLIFWTENDEKWTFLKRKWIKKKKWKKKF